MKPRWWIVSVIANNTLSAEARALLIYLGTRPAGWRYSVEECQRAMNLGRQKYQRVMREVKEAGFVRTKHKRNRHGEIVATVLDVRDCSLTGRRVFSPPAKPVKQPVKHSTGSPVSRPPAGSPVFSPDFKIEETAPSKGEVVCIRAARAERADTPLDPIQEEAVSGGRDAC